MVCCSFNTLFAKLRQNQLDGIASVCYSKIIMIIPNI